MFGKNPIRLIEKGDGENLKVQSIFLTFQGEGPYTGFPSVFIRLGGCNLACSFCDTEFESFLELSLQNILETVDNLAKDTKTKLVVITGGEPFRQPIKKLCESLLGKGYKIQIESNGTLFQDIPEKVEVICSPKISNGKYHKIRPDLEKFIVGYKFILSDHLKEYSSIPDWNFGNKRIYLQPMDEVDEAKNLANKKLAMELAFKTGYIFSIQLHKILEIE